MPPHWYHRKSENRHRFHRLDNQGIIKSSLRAVEIMINEISANDLTMAAAINQYSHLFPGKINIPLLVIAPADPLKGGVLDFDPETIRINMRTGYKAAHQPRLITFPEIISSKKKVL